MVRFGRAIALVGLVLAPSAALAQIDLSGSWGARYHEDFPERIPGPELANFLGLPINESARQWALSWDPSRLTLPEHQCQAHGSPYIYRGPLQLRNGDDSDPVYLTEPLVKSQNFVLMQRQVPENTWLWPCQIVDEVVGRPAGEVPHYLPGQNPFVSEFATESGIPIEATMGGAETMYPEYMMTLRQPSASRAKPR